MTPPTCELCLTRSDGGNGVTTTHGFICYECVKWIHSAADETVALRDRPEKEILAEIDRTE